MTGIVKQNAAHGGGEDHRFVILFDYLYPLRAKFDRLRSQETSG